MDNNPNNNQYQQTPQQPPPTPVYSTPITPIPPATPTQQNNGLAIAAMIIGIASIVFGLVPFLGIILGLTAIIIGIVSLKHNYNKGMAVTGIITGAISTLWNITISAMLIMSFVRISIVGNDFINEVNDVIKSEQQERQAKIDSQKDFSKGMVAVFDHFEVKINSVKRNYIPEISYEGVKEGNELILLNITAKNISDSSKYFSTYNLSLDDSGNTIDRSRISIENLLENTYLSAEKSVTGDLVFEVTKDSNDLKLQSKHTVYVDGDPIELIYTLEI